MPSFDPLLLADWTSGTWSGPPPTRVGGYSIDTRTLLPGELFVAVRTAARDGHSFLPEAARGGASGALVAEHRPEVDLPQLVVADPVTAFQRVAFAHRSLFRGPVVGVTGSCGKTSTKDLLALLLGGGTVHRTPSNWNNALGVPLTLLGIDRALHRAAVVEVGSSLPGEIDTLARVTAPDAALITLVAPAHLEGFGSIEGVAMEKSRLAYHLRTGGFSIFPDECYFFACFRGIPGTRISVARTGSPLAQVDTLSPFRQNAAEYQTETTAAGGGGCRLTVRWPSSDQPVTFEVPTSSPGMASNAALALLAAGRLGVSEQEARERLPAWRPARFRGEVLTRGEALYFVDCYNSNPASLADTLDTFARTAPADRPRLYVLGGMAELGTAAPALHREAGARLRLRPEDRVFLVGDHAGELRDGILEAGNEAEQVRVMERVGEALPFLQQFSGAVLLKGSRIYRLESLLPPAPGGRGRGGERRCAC